MTDRKPDFYRVKFGRLWATGDYRTHSGCVGYAKVFMRETEAQDFTAAQGGRIVPVYVKVTRRPKLHDFAWALRRMREGKRVRREAWRSGYHIFVKYDVLCDGNPSTRPRYDVAGSNVLALDWQLYEPEVGS
jgi:hypothetical protein